MYAVIKTGGKQMKVQVGETVYVEKLDVADGEVVSFDALLIAGDDDVVRVGTPVLSEKVEGKVVRQVKGAKVIAFRYKAKKNVRKKQGHRQPYTQVEITAIG